MDIAPKEIQGIPTNKESGKVGDISKGVEAAQPSGSVPVPVVPARATHQLERGVSGQLIKMGHYGSSPEAVSADKSPGLEDITHLGGEIVNDAKDYINTGLNELGGDVTDLGKGERVVTGKEGLEIAAKKAGKIKQFFSSMRKKAA